VTTLYAIYGRVKEPWLRDEILYGDTRGSEFPHIVIRMFSHRC